jgi:hypothetical protein
MKNIWLPKHYHLPLQKNKNMEMLLENEIEQNELPTTDVINKATAKALIKATKGKFFTVTFIKKDGTKRVMNCRLGVKAYLRGGELSYNPESKNLIPVYDIGAKGYRMINVNTITDIKIGNKELKVQ